MATKPTTTRRRVPAGNKALETLGSSIDAAQAALKDLRGELSKGGKDAVKELDVMLRDARKHLRGAQRTLVKDLEQVQETAKAKAASARGAASRASSSRTPAKRATPTAKRTTSSKSGAARPRSTRKSS
jgi:hypothetical protein